MNSFTRSSIQMLRADIETALKAVGAKHNVIIGIAGNGRFTSDQVTFSKLTAAVKNPVVYSNVTPSTTTNNPDPYNTLESREYLNLGYLHSLKKEWLGKEFRTWQGTKYRIIGLKNSRRKYPVVGISARGTRYKFTVQQVKSGIIL